MLRIKWQFKEVKRSVVVTQRIFRGYMGRQVHHKSDLAVKQDRQMKFFHEQAKIVQK